MQPESCSSTVTPPSRPRTSVWSTDAGVAPGAHSRPQVPQSTGVSPSSRAVSKAGPLNTPYGGRKSRGRVPVTLAISSVALVKSERVARGPRTVR